MACKLKGMAEFQWPFYWRHCKAVFYSVCYMHHSRSAPAFETALKIHLFKSANFWSIFPCILWLIHKKKLCQPSPVVCVCVCVFMLACMGMCGRVRGWGVLSNVHSNSRPCFPAPFLQTLPLVLPLKGHSWSLDICLQKSPIWVSQSAPSVKFAKGLTTKTVEATQC